jgi:hypothetical protein
MFAVPWEDGSVVIGRSCSVLLVSVCVFVSGAEIAVGTTDHPIDAVCAHPIATQRASLSPSLSVCLCLSLALKPALRGRRLHPGHHESLREQTADRR